MRCPTTPKGQALWFGLFPFRSPLLRKSSFLSLPRGNEMFQFPRSASDHPMDSGGSPCPSTSGLPHSEISGSKLTYSSPEHIGVRPVLHRLLAPRHPPCALRSFSYQAPLRHAIWQRVINNGESYSPGVHCNLTKKTHVFFSISYLIFKVRFAHFITTKL
jgi:hypothetical protein